MILQELAAAYDQMSKDPSSGVASYGWAPVKVAGYLELDRDGALIGLVPAAAKRGDSVVMPQPVERTSGSKANFLCDNLQYLMGLEDGEPSERALMCFEHAKKLHEEMLSELESQDAQAIVAFFQSWNPHSLQDAGLSADELNLLESNGSFGFRVEGHRVQDDPLIAGAWDRHMSTSLDEGDTALCLVSGKVAPVARIHTRIKHVYGGQPSGAALVSFNKGVAAFESYGHKDDQGLNAPVSQERVFAYASALKKFLSDDRHHVRVGDATVAFWADKDSDSCSTLFEDLLNFDSQYQNKEDQAAINESIKLMLQKIARAELTQEIPSDTRFFVLGLSPNAGRISVKFFYVSTFGKVINNIAKHYERIEIVRPPWSNPYPGPRQLLESTENPNSNKKGSESAPLVAAFLRAVVEGTSYPAALLSRVVMRVRQNTGDQKVTPDQAALIKAIRLKNSQDNKEVPTVALNKDRTDAPYLLGRIFATLEHIQQDANPGVNATIKDKYFDSFCATPSRVFALLVEGSNAHLRVIARNKEGLAKAYNKLIGALIDSLEEVPKRLNLEEQADFMLGYYQQRQDFYTPKNNDQDQTQEA